MQKLQERILEAQELLQEKFTKKFLSAPAFSQISKKPSKSEIEDFSAVREPEAEIFLRFAHKSQNPQKPEISSQSDSHQEAKIPPALLVYNLLFQNPKQTKEELSASTGLSRATITRAIQKLESEGKIKRIGANKNGHWQVES